MELEQRIRRLERTNRILMAVVGLGVAGALAGAAYKPDVIQASRFEVLDPDGHERGTLTYEDGCATLRLKDASGATRIDLGLMKGGDAFIGGYSPDKKALGAIIVPMHENPFVGILDRDGSEHAIRP
ncbi:MAG TPA: hypothetical protein VFT74_03650 [Isosphaeraceae bacterium]|nr:hypothetical protein [Isosphaeraceae bacterium]